MSDKTAPHGVPVSVDTLDIDRVTGFVSSIAVSADDTVRQAAERLRQASIAAKVAVLEADYCNVCENFPCMGGHPPEG
jgi:hypothetical protein